MFSPQPVPVLGRGLALLALLVAPTLAAMDPATVKKLMTSRAAISEEYQALLPPFCRTSVPSGILEERWRARLGKGGIHTHHYCWGRNSVNVANRLQTDHPEHAQNKLKSAVGDFQYVLERTDSGFLLRPEILVHRARALLRLERNAEAVADLNEAIAVKPDYPLSYNALADYYAQRGDREQALKVVRRGLEKIPNSKSLRRRLKELGG